MSAAEHWAITAGQARLDAPVTPDPDQARQWATNELSKGVYHQQESLLTKVWNWLQDWWSNLVEAGARTNSVPLAAIIVLVLLALVAAVIIWRRVGAARLTRARRSASAVFTDDRRTSAEWRANAANAAADGRWRDAAMDQFRAMVRSLEERLIIDERPGRTAHEVADDARIRLPLLGEDLRRAADRFDALRYGSQPATEADYRDEVEVDQRVGATRPTHLADASVDAREVITTVSAAP